MNLIKKHTAKLLIMGLMISLASCGLFRKKNKCNTCPKWNDEPAAHESMENDTSAPYMIKRRHHESKENR